MALKTEYKKIKDAEYAVTQLPATRALRLKISLAKMFGTGLGGLGSSKGAGEAEMMGAILGALFANIDEDKTLRLIKEMLAGVQRNNKDITDSEFEMCYAGNFDELYQALWFVLEVNFGNFFKNLNFGSLKGKLNRMGQSTNTES